MLRLNYVLVLPVLFLFQFLVPSSAAAQSNKDEIARLRMEQSGIYAQVVAIRGRRELVERMIEDKRFVVVPMGISKPFVTQMVTMDDALKVWTIEYFDRLFSSGRKFSSSDLAEWLKRKRDTALLVKSELKSKVQDLDNREARLKEQWGALESRIAELMGIGDKPAATASARADDACVYLVSTETSDTPLSRRISAPYGGRYHMVQAQGSHGGKPIDVLLAWSAPPKRLCEGEEFAIEMIATNKAVAPGGMSLNYVGAVSVSGFSGVVDLVSCDNPPQWIDVDDNDTPVAPDMPEYTNTCTYRVVHLQRNKEPHRMLMASPSIHTVGVGQVTYSYSYKNGM